MAEKPVAKPLGTITFTRMPNGASSYHSDPEKTSRPNLVAWQGTFMGKAVRPHTKVMLMITPDFCARSSGCAARVTANTPKILAANYH